MPSARSALSATSFAEPSGAWLPEATRPASMTTASGVAPEPSICRLQRMQRPALGMPCGSGRPVGLDGGSWPGPSARPITAIRFWAFGQRYWYS